MPPIKPTDQNRIRDLERTMSSLERAIDGLRLARGGSNVDQIIRPARTTTAGTGGKAVSIIFEDVSYDGSLNVSHTSRSSSADTAAAIMAGEGYAPAGTKVSAYRTPLCWIAIPSPGKQFTYIKAPNAGIPKRVGNLLGSAMCYICTFSSTTGMYTVTAEQIQVFNPISSVVLDKGDHFGRAAFFEGGWHVDVGDCGDAGSGLGTAGMVFYGTGSTGTYTAPA